MGAQSYTGLESIITKVTKLTEKNGPASILIIGRDGLPVIHVTDRVDDSNKKAAYGAALTNEIYNYAENYCEQVPNEATVTFENFKLVIQKYDPFVVLSEWDKMNYKMTEEFTSGMDKIMEELIEELT